MMGREDVGYLSSLENDLISCDVKSEGGRTLTLWLEFELWGEVEWK